MKTNEIRACIRQAKRESKGISDFIHNVRFEIFLYEQRKHDISRV